MPPQGFLSFDNDALELNLAGVFELGGGLLSAQKRIFAGATYGSDLAHEQTNSNLAAAGANAQARNAAFHSGRPVVADQGLPPEDQALDRTAIA